MEVVIVAAVAAAVLYALQPRPRTPSTPGGSGSPSPGSRPPPAAALPPGAYPAGTPGAVPVVLYVQGGDNDARLYATPGSYAGPLSPKTKTVWYARGTRVTFQAKVDPGLFSFTGFDHFEGPGGASTRDNPFSQTIEGPGYVRAVFSWLGQVGH